MTVNVVNTEMRMSSIHLTPPENQDDIWWTIEVRYGAAGMESDTIEMTEDELLDLQTILAAQLPKRK